MSVQGINDAFAKINKGKDIREEMALVMAPNANWEEFVTAAPMCIALLGDLIYVSTAADFSLENKPPKGGFKLLKWPHSFRTSLVQVANSGYDAFDSAHSSMGQIHQLTSNVQKDLKSIVDILIDGTNEDVVKLLPIPLEGIKDTADRCLHLAEETESKYIHVMNVIAELLEASVSTRGQIESDLQETKIALQVAKENKKTAEEQKELDKKQYDDIEKTVKNAEETFNKAMEQMPAGAQLLGMHMFEGVVDSFTRTIDGVASYYTFCMASVHGQPMYIPPTRAATYKRFKTGEEFNPHQPSVSPHQPSVDPHQPSVTVADQGTIEIYGTAILMQRLTDILASKCIEIDTLKPSLQNDLDNVIYVQTQFNHILNGVRSLSTNDVEIKKRADNLCVQGIQVCRKIKDLANAFQDVNEEGQTLAKEILALHFDVMTFATEGIIAMGSSPTSIKGPFQRIASQEAEESSDVCATQQAVNNARFKVEQASANLESTRDRYEKANDKMIESSTKLGKILADMQRLDVTQLDFEQIKQTLIKGIKALGELREKWAKLVMFFRMISNLIRCSLNTSLQRVLEVAEVIQPNSISKLHKDMIYHKAFESAKIAYVVNMISGTYNEVSTKFLMSQIAGLSTPLGYDPQEHASEITMERVKRLQDMENAQKGITDLLRRRKEEFNQQIAARVNEIKSRMEAVLPNDEPSTKTKEQIQCAVKKGVENGKESNLTGQRHRLDRNEFY